MAFACAISQFNCFLFFLHFTAVLSVFAPFLFLFDGALEFFVGRLKREKNVNSETHANLN